MPLRYEHEINSVRGECLDGSRNPRNLYALPSTEKDVDDAVQRGEKATMARQLHPGLSAIRIHSIPHPVPHGENPSGVRPVSS